MTTWLRLCVAAIAAHVIDDSFAQPEPGTAAGGHTGGLAARPEQYERRVVGFFDAALLR